jgi:hypothetical protein
VRAWHSRLGENIAVVDRPGVQDQSASWFHSSTGVLLARCGDVESAVQQIGLGLAPLVVAALANLKAAR